MQSNFLLGTLHITEDAKASLKRIPFDLIARHAINEHGLVTRQETRSNEMAMRTVGQIISRYAVDPTNSALGRVLIITHAAWGETLIKLESE